MEVVEMKSTTAFATIKVLREIFAQFGLPITILSDNGLPFNSAEFNLFLVSNSIKHRTSPPYFPQSNGQVECYVKTIKQGLKSLAKDGGDPHPNLQNFLMAYRKIPHAVTGSPPATHMLKRNLRSRIDLMVPNVTVKSQIDKYYNAKIACYEFDEGEKVYFKTRPG